MAEGLASATSISGDSDVSSTVGTATGAPSPPVLEPSNEQSACDMPAQLPVQHDTYYLDIEDIKLQAGNVVFRVHAYFFTRESDKTRELVEQSRLSPDRLVVLEDVSPKDLESFFKVLYCR
jgi:hypothetical protein